MSEIGKSESIIAAKTYSLALEIIKLYKYLVNDKKEFVLPEQILRSGTSVGANVNEALCGRSKRDFVHKLSIVLKEVREIIYWFNLLKDSDYIDLSEFDLLNSQAMGIMKMSSSIILTTKERYFKK